MASSQSSHSNDVTDISHVLENLGSLIGELNSLEVNKVDEVNDCGENSHCTTDLSLESLTADTDELDNQGQKFLFPHQSSQVQKSSYGSFSQDDNRNFIAPQHVINTCDQIHDRHMGDASCHNHNSMPTRLRPNEDHTSHIINAAQSQNSPYSRTHQPTNHNSVQSGARPKGDSTSLFNSLRSQNSTSKGHVNQVSEPPPGARPKGLNDSNSNSSQSHNPELSRKQAHKSYYSMPSSRGGHRSALKEVALGGQVHGSFKKLDEDSKASVALNCADIQPSHPKAEPNHYVAPGELGLPRHTQVQRKPDAQGSNMVQDVRFTKLSRSQEVPVNVYNEDDKPIGLLVSCSMTAREACHKLVLLNKAEDDPQWALVEHLTDLGLERHIEDHENVMAILNTWAPHSTNKLLFRKDSHKYHFFAHTSNYFPPHLLDSENSDKAVTEKAQKAKTILHQKLFSTCTRVPEVEGLLHCKEFGKKSWSKKFIFLRGSGLYSSSKGKSKASKDLESYVQFDGANLYSILYPKKSHKAPTEFCFCIVPYRARDFKELKCFSVDDEKTLMSWTMAVRIAKFGPQLRQNYDDMLRKFAKLTKYLDRQSSASNHQNVMSERDGGEIVNNIATKEGQVAMDFTGKSGKVITNSKEIQKLANTRNKVKINQRSASQNFIHCDTAVDVNGPIPDVLHETPARTHYFTSEPWYHGRITREQSLKLLLAAGVHDGLFLVRESTTVAGVFVLTFCMNKRVYHCQLIQDIRDGTQTWFSLGKGPAFKTLKKLIDFYQKKPLNGVSLALRIPCPKTEYSGYIES